MPTPFRFRIPAHALVVCLLFVSIIAVPTGCGPRPQSADNTPRDEDAPGTNPLLTDRTGWLRRVPPDADVFFGLYKAADRVKAVLRSPFVSRVLANPLVRPTLPVPPDREPSPDELLETLLKQTPDADHALRVINGLLGQEVFVFLPGGSVRQLRQLQAMLETVRMAQLGVVLENLTSPQGEPADGEKLEELQALRTLAALEPLIPDLEFPTVVMGFRAPALRGQLTEQWSASRTQLPAGLSIETWTPDGLGVPLDLVTLRAGVLFPPEAQADLRRGLEDIGQRVGDTDLANRMMPVLMAKEIQLAFGYAGDTLLVIIGSKVLPVGFVPADTPQQSLAASDVMAPMHSAVEDAEELAALSYASREFVDWTSPPMAFADVFEALRPAAEQLLPAESLDPIASSLADIDQRAQRIFPRAEAPSCGLVSAGACWTFDSFGGLPPAFLDPDSPVRLQGVALPDAAIFWASRSASAQVGELFDLISDFAGLAVGVFENDVLPQLPPEETRQFRQVSAVFRPKIEEAWALLRELNTAVLGAENAFVVDFQGALPESAALPPHLSGMTSLPRLGIFWSAANPANFGPWWNKTRRLMEDLASFIPADAGVPVSIPEFRIDPRPEGTYAFAPLPIPPEFDSPAGFAGKDSLGVASSASLLGDLAAVHAGGLDAGSFASEFHLRLPPVAAALKGFAERVAAHPEAFFGDNPVSIEEFRTNKTAIIDLIDSLNLLGGMSYTITRKNTVWQRTSVFGPQD